MPDVTASSSFRLSHRGARCLVSALAASALIVGCQVGTRSPRSPSVEQATVAVSRALASPPPPDKVAIALTHTGDGAVPELADAGATLTQADAATSPALPSLLAGPVPLGRGDPQRSGRSPYRLSLTQPKELWRVCTGGSIASAPTVARDGTVLFSSHDRHVYAVSAAGSLRWKHRTGDMIWSAAALLSRPDAAAGGAVDEALVLVGSDDDKLHALRLLDGSVAWQLSPGGCRRPTGRGPEAARCDIEDVTLSDRGIAYFAGAAIYAASPEGKILWSFVPEFPPDKKPHCSSAPALAPDGSLRAVCQDKLYALGPDGSKRWQIEGPGEFDSAPAIGPDGTAYIGDEARRFLAIDAAGQQRFSFISGGPVRAAPALRADGSVVFGAYDGVLYALRADGTLAWSFATADSIQSAPLVDADGAVVFGSRDNRVYGLNPDGSLRWSLVLEEDIDGPPAIGPDGTLYIGSDDRCLHAFK
jgi:outer membrane protein assembly factor BamB